MRTSPDPSNRMDDGHLSDETDEQIPTAEESTVDSSGKSSYHFVFLIACIYSWHYDSFDLEKKAKKWGGPFFGRRWLLGGSYKEIYPDLRAHLWISTRYSTMPRDLMYNDAKFSAFICSNFRSSATVFLDRNDEKLFMVVFTLLQVMIFYM